MQRGEATAVIRRHLVAAFITETELPDDLAALLGLAMGLPDIPQGARVPAANPGDEDGRASEERTA